VAARSKAQVCSHSPAEIVGSNLTGDMDVCCGCWVLSDRSLRRADHSSRGVLPTVVQRCVWSRNLVTEESLAQWGLLLQIKTIYIYIYLYIYIYKKTGVVLYMRYYFGNFYERNVQQRGIQNGNCLGQYSKWAPNPKTSLKFYCYTSQLSYNVLTAWQNRAVLTHVEAECNVPNRQKEDQIFKKIEL